MYPSISLWIRCTIFVCLCAIYPIFSVGQKPPSIPGCGTDELMRQLRQSPNFDQHEQQQNIELRNYLLKQAQQSLEKSRPRPPIQTLPIVVHVIHQNGDENISFDQILQGVSDLNEGFANVNSYDRGSGLDTEIRFCLATIDPNGNFTNGVTRKEHSLTVMNMNKDDAALKNIVRWDPTRYINIWLVEEILPACDIDPAGYATLPGAHGGPLDGIVCEASTFGFASKVAIHEMGHYLGLLHTFEGGCSNGDCTLEGDLICDTPPDNTTGSLPNCEAANSCATDSLSGFDSDVADLATNYMDYGNLGCFHDFTPNQSERMNGVVATIRASLLATPTCVTICDDGVLPTSYFEMSANEIREGGTITFTKIGPDADYEWQINGTTVSTDRIYNHTFNEGGTYTVTLVVRKPDNGVQCMRMIHELVNVTCGLDAGFKANTSDILPGESILFTSDAVGATSFEWLVNGQSVATGISHNHLFDEKGNYRVQMVARNSTCVDTSKAIVYYIGTQYSDATLDFLDYVCSNDSITINFEVCNQSDASLPATTPIQFYDNHPFNTPAAHLGNYITLEEALPCDCCVEMTHSFPRGNIVDALYGIVNDGGTKLTPLMQADYPLTQLEELNYTNNMDTLLVDLMKVSFEPNLINLALGSSAMLNPLITPAVSDSAIYVWEPADSLSCVDCPNPMANPSSSTTYRLTVDDGLGCTSSDTIRIEIELGKKVLMPNAFSPNNDGMNDVFSVITDSSVKNVLDFRVYNRWGQLLYEQQNFNPKNEEELGWDGTYQGELAMMGVYVYSVRVEYLDNETEQFKGNVTLIR